MFVCWKGFFGERNHHEVADVLFRESLEGLIYSHSCNFVTWPGAKFHFRIAKSQPQWYGQTFWGRWFHKRSQGWAWKLAVIKRDALETGTCCESSTSRLLVGSSWSLRLLDWKCSTKMMRTGNKLNTLPRLKFRQFLLPNPLPWVRSKLTKCIHTAYCVVFGLHRVGWLCEGSPAAVAGRLNCGQKSSRCTPQHRRIRLNPCNKMMLDFRTWKDWTYMKYQ